MTRLAANTLGPGPSRGLPVGRLGLTGVGWDDVEFWISQKPVSYTHLTLPTTPYV